MENERMEAQRTTLRFRGPIWTLMLLAPVIGEVLIGSTRLSILFVLIPEVLVWGGGALLCRELARLWQAGWVSLAVLGVALAVAEEFVIQQTSIAPLPFPGVNAAYGRWGGVNWVYFLFMLGYEAVWVVLTPVSVTEFLFPKRAGVPWLRVRGAIACGVGLLLGSRAAWYGWTQVARPRLGAPSYHPPMALLEAGIAAIAVLIGLAWLTRGMGKEKTDRRIAPAWAVGGMAAIASAAWLELLGQNFQAHPPLSAAQAVGSEIALAVVTFALFAVWAGSTRWSVRHAWAACLGAILAIAAVSSTSRAGYSTADFVFKNVVDVLALIGLAWLGARVWKRQKNAS
ncbi:hypothetical protein [Terracidiphilus gabretensis]|jgi:hypothetical protein|uniref:hypothetical protein n=1 Tax=Terracidiphilus gabretensis TaxID=1577687 RepID=UPI0012F81D8B|nr:hypothetical protein [Terracidiphilus gabretensis]